MPVAVDLPALAERIKVIAKTYNPNNNNNSASSGSSSGNSTSSGSSGSSSSGSSSSSGNSGNSSSENIDNRYNSDYSDRNMIRDHVGSMLMGYMVSEKSYWGRVGIRMVSASDFERCYTNNAKVLGRGMFGKFMSVNANSCIRGVPPGVKNVGVKTEYIKNDYRPQQSPEAVLDSFKIAKRAAKLGVGPDIYDLFVTKDSKGKIMIVKVSQIIDGKTWAATVWESPKQKRAAAEVLKILIQKMNEVGIIHHDLHAGNVMVDKSGRVYIIDYDLAKFVKNEEVKSLSIFNTNIPEDDEPVGVASEEGIQYVYDKLVEEGTIKEVQSGGSRSKTRKAKSKKNVL